MAGSSLQIPGNLNFGSAPAFDFSGNPASLGANYQNTYQNALNLNQQNYANILSGFQGTMAAQNQAQNQIQGGYGNLQASVLGGIQGIGASQSQAIADAYARQSGAEAQGLVSRGLGNTTVANSVQHGLMLDKQKADISLANQIAGLQAGYQSNIGLAGLNFGNQANMQNTALANQQLGWMNSVNAPYPNAGMYGQLAQQYGASQQQNRLFDALSAARGGGGGQRGIGIGSYVPAGGGFPQRNDFGGSVSAALGGGGPGAYNQLAIDQAAAGRLNQPQYPTLGLPPQAGTDQNPYNWATNNADDNAAGYGVGSALDLFQQQLMGGIQQYGAENYDYGF